MGYVKIRATDIQKWLEWKDRWLEKIECCWYKRHGNWNIDLEFVHTLSDTDAKTPIDRTVQ